MKPRHRLALAALSAGLVSAPAASAQTSSAGFGARYAVAYDAFADTHDRGWGLTWSSLADFGGTWLSLGGGWTRFDPLDVPEGEEAAPRIDQAEATVGLGVKSGHLYVGGRVGYFFRDQDEWDVLPTVSLRAGSLLLTAEAKVLGDVRWYGGSISLYSR